MVDREVKLCLYYIYAFLFALLLVVIAPATFELVEYAVVLVQDAQLIPQVVVHRIGLNGPILHVQVPYFYV